MTKSRIFWYDLLERVAWTFAQGFLAAWIVVGADFDALFTVVNLQVGVAAGAISAAKAVIATRIGDRNSAATLPRPPDYAPGD